MRGVDYAFLPHPGPASLKAAGVQWVGRYVSPLSGNDTNGKNLLPGECKALLDAGLEIVLFDEPGQPGRMKAGQAAGVEDAKHFAAVTKALGMSSIPGFFACDYDAPPGDQPAINAYLEGAASVIGHARTGLYGGYWPVKRALDAGKCAFACQTLAWSGAPRQPAADWDGETNWDHRAVIRQHLQIRVGGVSVDLDESRARDFGQWPRPITAKRVPIPPEKRRANGNISLRRAAHNESTTVARSIWLMSQDPVKVANGKFGSLQETYITEGDWDADMREGMVYWVG